MTWEEFFIWNDVTDPGAKERMQRNFANPQEYWTSIGQGQLPGGGGTDIFGIGGGEGGGDDMLTPADWQKDYVSGGLDYLKENRGMLMDRMGPHYASVEHLARTGQDVGTEDMITRGTEQMSRDIRSRSGAAGTYGANFMNAAEGMSERAGIGETARSRSAFRQWGSEQQADLDRTLAGFLGNTAGSYAALSGQAASMRNPALDRFGIMMGGQPWQSNVESMSGDRNPLPDDYYTFTQGE
ncbi:MAG: hypothetical protein LN412_06150 [Candidatus Thermoplasmatota archaeon]|nr:hypothetical protein [Candidatus Thermoplasmatota archaeon]